MDRGEKLLAVALGVLLLALVMALVGVWPSLTARTADVWLPFALTSLAAFLWC